MPCCFIDRIDRIEEANGKCSIRIGDWHPVDGTKRGCQISLLLANEDAERGIGETKCEALADLETQLGILSPTQCMDCEKRLADDPILTGPVMFET